MARVFHRSSKYGDHTVPGSYGTVYQTFGGWFVDLITNVYLGSVYLDASISSYGYAVTGTVFVLPADASPSGNAYAITGLDATVTLETPEGDIYEV